MNDELTNQLTTQWQIPAYAQDKLWVATETECVPISGSNGLFTLTQPSPIITVRWAGANGTNLVQLKWRADSLEWAGTVRIGGMVDAIHYIGGEDEETTLAVVTVSGQALKPSVSAFPRMMHASFMPKNRLDAWDGIDLEQDITISTWVLSYASPWFVFCQDALSNKQVVYLWGHLLERGDARNFLTPLALNEMTVFAS